MNTCECGKPIYCKKLCKTCYYKLYSRKKYKQIANNPEDKCCAENCNRVKYTKGYCQLHYNILKCQSLATDIGFIKCKIPNCELAHYAKGYCKKHYGIENLNNKSINSRYSQMKYKCKTKKLELDLTKDEYSELISRKCFYCSGDLNEMGVGLDRVDNNFGYIKNNVVPCCDKCNRLKHTSVTKDEMLEIIKLLKKLRNKENIW